MSDLTCPLLCTVCPPLQYECSSRNVEILESTTDAQGRKLEVIKVPCPPPMFRTHHEADTVDVSKAENTLKAMLLVPGFSSQTR
jgi:agmatine/peptidylarginine deiminase